MRRIYAIYLDYIRNFGGQPIKCAKARGISLATMHRIIRVYQDFDRIVKYFTGGK
jgi:hypothetical protein